LEGKNVEAEKTAANAVRNLTASGEQTLLAEALTTQGKALARIRQQPAARSALDRAIQVATAAGDPERGGIAAVSAIEEFGSSLSSDLLSEYYRTAESLLTNSQNNGLKVRLGQCARTVLSATLKSDRSIPATGLSLEEEVLKYEG